MTASFPAGPTANSVSSRVPSASDGRTSGSGEPPGAGGEPFHREVQRSLHDRASESRRRTPTTEKRRNPTREMPGSSSHDGSKSQAADGDPALEADGVRKRSGDPGDAAPGTPDKEGSERHATVAERQDAPVDGALVMPSPAPISHVPAGTGDRMGADGEAERSGVFDDGSFPGWEDVRVVVSDASEASEGTKAFDRLPGPDIQQLHPLPQAIPSMADALLAASTGLATGDELSPPTGTSLDALPPGVEAPFEAGRAAGVSVEAVWLYDKSETPPRTADSPGTPPAPGDGLHQTEVHLQRAETVSPSAAQQTEAARSFAGTRATESVTLAQLPGRIVRVAGELGEARTAGMRLRLDPPALGEIRVQIEATGQGIDVRIVAQSSEAAALLSDRQQQLREELARNGLVLQQFSTAVSSDAGQSAGAGTDDARPGWQPSRGARGDSTSLESPIPGAVELTAAESRSDRAGRLDTRA